MKLERLMAITILLLNRKRVQAQELAERMEVSLRTIYRDIESLSMSGIPIVSYTGNDGGFEIMDSFRLERQMLSLDELLAMFTALRGLHSSQALHDKNMEQLLEKVGALVSRAEQGRAADNDQVLIDLTPWKSSAAAKALYEALQSAVHRKKRVQFTYTTSKGEELSRLVEPLSVVLKGYTWYLHGYCLNRDDHRSFRLSRIRDLTVLTESFHRRPIPLSQINEQWKTVWDVKTIELVLRITGTARVRAMDHFDEEEVERQSDGSFLVRTQHPDNERLVGFLLGFKEELQVLEPEPVALAVRKSALEIAALYGERKK